jgi:asparagine synthase (glutamine-hydrolysing)
MLGPGVLPDGRFARYRKTAFRVPAAEWLRGPLQPALREQLAHGSLYGEGYFDAVAATRLADEHAAATHDHSDRLWPLLALGLWLDRFHGRDPD